METKSEILDFILGLSTDVERKSTLQLALEQARHLIGYDNAQGINRCCFETRNTEAIINEMSVVCANYKANFDYWYAEVYGPDAEN